MCGDDNFTIAKSGAYQCWGSQCKPEAIRNALSPLKKSGLPPSQRDKIVHKKQTKEVDSSTAAVKAEAEHYALMGAEDIFSVAEAHLRLSEWCKTTRHDRYAAKGVLDAFLNQLGVNDGTLDTREDAKVLRALVKAYAEETDLICRTVLRHRLRSRFRVNDAQLDALVEEVAPAQDLDFLHCSEDAEQDFLSRLQKLQSGDISPGFNTGLFGWDRMLGGIEDNTLHIIGGRPSQGKSVLAQNIVRHVLKEHRVPVAVFNLEMTTAQWKERWVAAERSIDHAKLRKGQIGEQQWADVLDCMSFFYELPLFLSEASGITPNYLRRSCLAIAEKAKEKYGQGLGLIVVDYLNLMQYPGEPNRVQEVSKIARALQSLAKEFCSVVALAQLNRGSTHTAVKEPNLESLRESGEIEQVAESVTLVHRPGKYDESIPDSVGKLILAKNRQGQTGACEVLFQGEYARFRDANGRIG